MLDEDFFLLSEQKYKYNNKCTKMNRKTATVLKEYQSVIFCIRLHHVAKSKRRQRKFDLRTRKKNWVVCLKEYPFQFYCRKWNLVGMETSTGSNSFLNVTVYFIFFFT